jgi:DNA-binding NtrC family response regulator
MWPTQSSQPQEIGVYRTDASVEPAMRPRILVADDLTTHSAIRSLQAVNEYDAIVAASAEEAIARFLRDKPAAVVIDVDRPGDIGLQAIDVFRRVDRNVPIIVVSSKGLTTTVMQALKLGATSFINKPFEGQHLEICLTQALRQRRVSREVKVLRGQLESASRHPLLFGQNERMAEIATLIEQIADTDVTVLIRGESGTGKELVARALTAASRRRDKPFVKVNCAAIPSELLESELFGFERGAFTNAVERKPGKFEFANSGTILLDEIGDISFSMQAKLLHVLQDGEFCRLGGAGHIHADVRVIAATNRDLDRAVAEEQFRKDLFFRLNVISITMPPLRDRRDDIGLLTNHFLKTYSVRYNKPITELSPEVTRLFFDYDWPGNIRELENAIKRIVVLGSDAVVGREIARARARPRGPVLVDTSGAGRRAGSSIGEASAPPWPPNRRSTLRAAVRTPEGAPVRPPAVPTAVALPPSGLSLKDISREAARQAEREVILQTLQRTRWNRKAAAALLSISYKALLYKMKENGLDGAVRA